MKKLKQNQLEILEQHLASIHICKRPSDGWIRAIRKSLGMNVRQLANRIGITQQSTSQLESNEIHDTITLKSLRRVAAAMNCQLVYALIPNEHSSLENIVRRQAFKKAKEIVESVDHSMMLEAQTVGDTKKKIQQITDELVKNLDSTLWDK